MPRVVLVEPEIPPNTGSVARLCAGMKIPLHLVKPLGFSLDDKYMKRAGLDYWPYVDLHVHESWDDFIKEHGDDGGRFWLMSKKNSRPYTTVKFKDDDWLVFGKETKGLGEKLLESFSKNRLYIPIIGNIRSYNLANSVSIVLFEALRQTQPQHFRFEEET